MSAVRLPPTSSQRLGKEQGRPSSRASATSSASAASASAASASALAAVASAGAPPHPPPHPSIKASASDTSLRKALVRKQQLPKVRSSATGPGLEERLAGTGGSSVPGPGPGPGTSADPAAAAAGTQTGSSSSISFWRTPLVKLKGVSSRPSFARKAFEVAPGTFKNFGEYVHFQRTKPVGKRLGSIEIDGSEALLASTQEHTIGGAGGGGGEGGGQENCGAIEGQQPLDQDDDEESLDSEEEERLLEDGVRALHNAALANDAKRIRFLLCGPDSRRVLPSPDLSLADDITRATPALKAARAGCAAAVAVLLDAKADPLVRDDSPRFFGDGVWPDERRADSYGSVVPKDRRDEGALPGRTVIYWLRLTGKFREVVENLFPITRVSLVRSITSGVQEHHGDPALLVAARDGLPDLAALIVNHTAAGLPPLVGPASGATYNVAMSSWPGSPSTSAAAAMPMPFAGFTSGGGGLMSANAGNTGSSWSSPCKSTTRERSHALLAACSSKEWKVALVLLGSGVPPSHMSSTKDRLGRTALHIAACNGATEVVKALVRAGHPVRNVSYRGRQPIHEACYAGHQGCVVALLDGRADPAAVAEEDSSGSGRLIASVGQGEFCTGMTALEVAQKRGHSELAKLLLQHQGARAGIVRPSTSC